MHQRRETARQRAAREQALDRAMNAAKRDELAAYGVPQYALIISPIEAQALSEGIVSTAILKQLQILLKPEPLTHGTKDFTPTRYRGPRP